MTFKKSLILLALALPILDACSGKAPPLPPLAAVSAPIPVETVWFKHINTSSKIDLTKYVPAVDGSNLFTSDEKGDVGSVQLATGQNNWRIRLKPGASGGVAVGSGMVYVPTQNGEIYALDESTGAVRWHTVLPNQSNTAPTYADARLYVKTIDDKLIALNVGSGQILWSYDEGATQLQLLGSSRAAVSGNTVIAGFSDGKVDAINTNTGELVWQTTVATPSGFSDIAQMVGIFADPVVSGSTVFVGAYNGSLVALDVDSGAVKWQHMFSTYQNIAVTDRAVFAVSPGGHIIGLGRTKGNIIWKQDALSKRILSGAVIDGNNVVVGDNQGNLHWLSSQDGHFTAREPLGQSAIGSTPVVAAGNVIVSTQNGNIYVLRLAK